MRYTPTLCPEHNMIGSSTRGKRSRKKRTHGSAISVPCLEVAIGAPYTTNAAWNLKNGLNRCSAMVHLARHLVLATCSLEQLSPVPFRPDALANEQMIKC